MRLRARALRPLAAGAAIAIGYVAAALATKARRRVEPPGARSSPAPSHGWLMRAPEIVASSRVVYEEQRSSDSPEWRSVT
jgi:hypothetical protein